MTFLKILVIIILILFPFGEILRFDIGHNIAIKPLDITIGIIAVWWCFLYLKKNQKSKIKNQNYNTKLKNSLILFVTICFLSLILNLIWLRINEFFVSLLYLLRFVSYGLLFPIILQLDPEFKKKIVKLLLIDGLVILVIGYIQYFFFNSLKNLYFLGWDEHMHRMFSVFFDPNFAGAFFVLFVLFISGILYNQKNKNRKQSILLSLTLLLSLVAIFLTFSRSAILMLIAGAITFLVIINKKKLVFILLLAILLFGVIVSPKFNDENMNLFRTNSTGARLASYELALRVIQDHPVIGVGFNSYRYTKDLYGLDHDWVNAPSHADAGVDNSFLFVLATTGIVGGITYASIWFFILKRTFKLYKKNILAAVVISSSIGLFVNSLFINSLFFAPIMLWMWVMNGLIEDN